MTHLGPAIAGPDPEGRAARERAPTIARTPVTAGRVTPPRLRTGPTSGASWAGRASGLRREQVRNRGPEPDTQGPTGPAELSRGAVDHAGRRATLDADRVQELCAPVVQMLLRELEGLSSVLVCNADGAPLAAFGLPEASVSAAARRSKAMFRAGGGRTSSHLGEDGTKVVNVTSGQVHTVITAVPTPGHGDHLLSVVAEGTSPGVMLLRTRQAADDLRAILAAAADH